MIKKATTKMGSSLDWDDLESDAEAGVLMERLQKIPREQWTEKHPRNGATYLHVACYGPATSLLFTISPTW